MKPRATGLFPKLCVAQGLPAPVAEFTFHETRKWRFDWAWPEQRIALECNGGIWVQGRHSRGSGLLKEHEKMNAAAVLGWKILYATPQNLNGPATFATLKEALT